MQGVQILQHENLTAQNNHFHIYSFFLPDDIAVYGKYIGNVTPFFKRKKCSKCNSRHILSKVILFYFLWSQSKAGFFGALLRPSHCEFMVSHCACGWLVSYILFLNLKLDCCIRSLFNWSRVFRFCQDMAMNHHHIIYITFWVKI